jgi:hypothetical protein
MDTENAKINRESTRMNANETTSTADKCRLAQMRDASQPTAPRRQLTNFGIQSVRIHSHPFAVATILLATAGMLAQPASAGPFDALKNFFVRPQPQAHGTRHRPAHPKEAKDAPKDAPNDSPSPVAPPVDQQTNQQPNGVPAQQNTLNTNNRQGRPEIAAAPLF